MGEYIYMSATDLARLIRSGKATSTEIVKDHLERINKLNPTLNAVVISLADEALETAAACDGKDIVYINYTWPYTACFNASGHPGMNIPLGLNDAGLPVGVQVVGPYWSEPELIHFAGLVSDFTEGFVRPVVGEGQR